MDTFLSFLAAAVQATLWQVIGIFGILFLLGFVLAKIQHATHNNYTRLLGWKGLYITAWIGTPVHEISHVLLAKLFRHRIEHVSLFSPNEETGGLGHVEHSYSRKSLYQQIGNAFIGAAPMLLGPLVLLGLLKWLAPEIETAWTATMASTSLAEAVSSLLAFIELLRTLDYRNPLLWAFFYLSFSIVSHMAPSKPDRKSMWRGLGWLVGVMIVANLILLFLGGNPERFTQAVSGILSVYTVIFVYALLISCAHYLVTKILFGLPTRLLGR